MDEMTLRKSVDAAVWQSNVPYSTILDKKIDVEFLYASSESLPDDEDDYVYHKDWEYSFCGTYAEWLFHISTMQYPWIGDIERSTHTTEYTKITDAKWQVVRYE